jgi:hypothetical protein
VPLVPDLRTVLPWDFKAAVESVQRIGGLVIVHGAGHTAGVGGIAGEIQYKAFLQLQRLRASYHWLSLGVSFFIIYSYTRLKNTSVPVGLQFEKFIEENCSCQDDDYE